MEEKQISDVRFLYENIVGENIDVVDQFARTDPNIILAEFTNNEGYTFYLLEVAAEIGRDMLSVLTDILVENNYFIPRTQEEQDNGLMNSQRLLPYRSILVSISPLEQNDLYNDVQSILRGEITHIPTEAEYEETETQETQENKKEEEKEAMIEKNDFEILYEQNPISIREVLKILNIKGLDTKVIKSKRAKKFKNMSSVKCTMGMDMITITDFSDTFLNVLQKKYNDEDEEREDKYKENSEIISFLWEDQIYCTVKKQLVNYWDTKKLSYRGVIISDNEDYEDYLEKKIHPENNQYFLNIDMLPNLFFLLENAIVIMNSDVNLFSISKTSKRWYDTNPPGVSVYHNSYKEDGDAIYAIIPVKKLQ